MSSRLPIVDFAALSLDKQDDEVARTDVITVGKQLVEAFSSVGFVYVKNSGFDNEKLEKATTETETFFNLPIEIKNKYARRGNQNHGWVSMERESLNPDRPGDLKEAFNVTPANASAPFWPDLEVPGLQNVTMEIIRQCDGLANRIFMALALGLDLEDPEFFAKTHTKEGSLMTSLRYLRYPPVPEDTKPGQIRCGEHSDYGSITLLFQDDIGGLQLYNTAGEWVSATPVPGAVLINIGDLMQRWTADKLKSTKHRVIIPEEELRRKKTRRSMAYFLHPDNDVMITCLDGSNKYEPINSLDYLHIRFAATY